MLEPLRRTGQPDVDGVLDRITLVAASADFIERELTTLQQHLTEPEYVTLPGDIPAFRYKEGEQHDLLMSLLKCLRSVSLLHGANMLLMYGFYQEVGILIRCIKESAEDVLFVSTPLGVEGKPSEPQRAHVAEFFEETARSMADAMASEQKKARVPREKISAGVARIGGNPLNPSDGKKLHELLHKGYSGYVHGSYPSIMELYGALPDENGKPAKGSGRYYLRGHLPAARTLEMAEALVSEAHSVAVASAFLAKRFGNAKAYDLLDEVIGVLAEATESDNIGDVNKAVARMKAGKSVS
jgi:hypothetical protein